MNRKKIIITTAILINMLMCSCGSESNNIGDSELKAETIADNEVAKSEIITKEIAEESIKSIISEESDKSDFVISKNILISYKGCDSHVIILCKYIIGRQSSVISIFFCIGAFRRMYCNLTAVCERSIINF